MGRNWGGGVYFLITLGRDVSFIDLFFTVVDKQPMILKWRILSATNDLDRVSAVALPKLPISLTNTDLKVANDTKFFPGLGKEFLLSFS